jgi:hypothetical protein
MKLKTPILCALVGALLLPTAVFAVVLASGHIRITGGRGQPTVVTFFSKGARSDKVAACLAGSHGKVGSCDLNSEVVERAVVYGGGAFSVSLPHPGEYLLVITDASGNAAQYLYTVAKDTTDISPPF